MSERINEGKRGHWRKRVRERGRGRERRLEAERGGVIDRK